MPRSVDEEQRRGVAGRLGQRLRGAWSLDLRVRRWRQCQAPRSLEESAVISRGHFDHAWVLHQSPGIMQPGSFRFLLDVGRSRIGRDQGADCRSIAPRRAPVARSMIRSWRPPSGSANANINRSVPAVIASIRAPRGMMIGSARTWRAALGAGPPRDILTAIAASRTANPTTSITPMTTTRILSPRILTRR